MFRVNGWYGHVRRNNLRSAMMFAGFIVAFQLIALVVLSVPLVFWDLDHAPFPNLTGYLTRYVPAVFAAGGALFLFNFLRHVGSVRATLEFGYANRWTDPRLYNTVEVQAIAAGLPRPKVGVIESQARNAFACGLGARSAVVVVTRGLVEALDDDELSAVVAHEVAHIKNGDIRLVAAANVLMDNLRWLRRQNRLRIKDRRLLFLAVAVPPLLVAFLLAPSVIWVAMMLARVSRRLISTSREFVADAEAVRMTHNPAALISALRRIEGRSTLDGISPQADAMMIDGAVEGAYASHPSIAERIAVLAHLSGGMAHVSPARKDTRTAEQVAANRTATFGRKGLPMAEQVPPHHGPVGKANADDDALPGMRSAAGLLVAAAIVGAVALGGGDSRSLLAWLRADILKGTHEKAPSAGRGAEGGTGTFAADPAAAEHDAPHRAASAGAASARCFATGRYRVGDSGLFRVIRVDPALVQAFSTGNVPGQPEVKLERYLGFRNRTVSAVGRAMDAEIDQALLNYVETRKHTLEESHHFFGKPGLLVVEAAYGGTSDTSILNRLRQRMDARAPALVADAQVAAEIGLLVSAPQDFIPCAARAP